MTKKDPQYLYPTSERDVGKFITQIELITELPAQHGDSAIRKKGDWSCASCGEANLCMISTF